MQVFSLILSRKSPCVAVSIVFSLSLQETGYNHPLADARDPEQRIRGRFFVWNLPNFLKALQNHSTWLSKADVVHTPEFTPRNTTTGVFGFWHMAGPKETRPEILDSHFRLSDVEKPAATRTVRGMFCNTCPAQTENAMQGGSW
jgi:hypothetical protein